MAGPRTLKTQIAIVGLGAAGAAALWSLARAGADVVGIEQFAPAHDQGSSHGQTRLLRVAYAEGERYVPLVRRAIALWRELEADAGEAIFHQTGVFYAGPAASTFITSSLDSARAHDVRVEHVGGAGAKNGLAVPSAWAAFVELEGGFLEPEKAIGAFVRCAERRGTRVLANTNVVAIEPGSNGVEIRTSAGTVSAERVVVAAGAWTSALLPSLADVLSVERRTLHWFEDPGSAYSRASGFKPFILETDEGLEFYGFPSIDARGVKVAEHVRGGVAPSPEAVDRTVRARDVDEIRALTDRYVPGLRGPIASAVCLYPMSKDAHFIVDTLPSSERIAVAAGLSGHGFKFASALGEAAAALALGRAPPVDVSFLSLKRFG